MKYVHAHTGVECVFLCMREDESCRSVNFRKTSNGDKNCEFLTDVHSERPEFLLKDEQFDHYILLNPSRVNMNCSYKQKIHLLYVNDIYNLSYDE